MEHGILKTEREIRFVKRTFSLLLEEALDLEPVSSPLAIADGTGINDDLNGTERPVTFAIREMTDGSAVIVQSLAKWKRIRLMELGIFPGKGIVTDMRALRPDEAFSPLHSVYVDQWDWELCISEQQRSLSFLIATVRKIYGAIKDTEKDFCARFPDHSPFLPDEITFIHAGELAALYPGLSPREREKEACLKYGAVFVIGIGAVLGDGLRHDGRAPDYDDWSTDNGEGYKGLNGDIIVWNPYIKSAFEISSMGIRVNRQSLRQQLRELGCEDRERLMYHRMLLDGSLPQTIGGGIGQSRLCMLLLGKAHIGEVQVGLWPDTIRKKAAMEGITLM